jgi:glycosyltransferase involved in cell wall biosynthesis
MYRILQVLPDLTPYGLERVVASLATLASSNRFRVSVACLFPPTPGGLTPELRAHGIDVFHLGKHPGLDMRMFPRLARVLRKVRPHVLHSHNYVLRYTLPVSILARVPVLVHTIHNVADKEVDRLGVMLQNWAFRGCVAPVAIADRVADSYERVYRLPRPETIFNGIDIDRYLNASGGGWRARNGFSSADTLITCVARFYPQKNHQTLLEAFARMARPETRLLLAGDGDLRPALVAQAERLGIAARVHFLGRRDDVPELLAASDVFALASLWEGNPLSVMEAMAAGLPVVSSRVGAIDELVTDGENGLLVAPGDAPALADALDRLAGDAAMRRAFGVSARRRAQLDFDHRVMTTRYEQLYVRLLNAHQSRDRQGVFMAPLGPPEAIKTGRVGGGPRLKPGDEAAPLTPGFSPGLPDLTFTGAVAAQLDCPERINR